MTFKICSLVAVDTRGMERGEECHKEYGKVFVVCCGIGDMTFDFNKQKACHPGR